MPNFQVVSRQRHGDKRWLRYSGYAFAIRDAVLPLALSELPKAVMSLPLAFLPLGGGQGYQVVAVMGLQSDQNLHIASDGRWLQGYIPAACRSYPFRMAMSTDGQQVLCVDEDSGLLSEEAGEAFFAVDGQPSPEVLEVMSFLQVAEQGCSQAVAAAGVLAKHSLLRPLLLRVQTVDGERSVEGLLQVDEAALNRLPPDVLLELRDAGALLLAYCQLLSLQHFQGLSQLAERWALERRPQSPLQGAVPLVVEERLGAGETFDFSGFR